MIDPFRSAMFPPKSGEIMQEHGAALTALEGWLRTRAEGNVADLRLDETASATLSLRGQTGFTFRWEDRRARAERPLSTPSLDAQVKAALAARPLDTALAGVAAASPRAWLRPLTDKALPDYSFRETKLETCDDCGGRRVVDCGGCRASGRVACGPCRGTGREDMLCTSCGGVGHFRRSRQVQVNVGNGYQWTTEYYNDPCWSCGGRGRRDETCRTCRGTREVPCHGCGGSGKVTCRDCAGQGARHYLYTRTALVSARSGLAFDQVEDETWRAMLNRRWETLLDRGSIALTNVRRKDGAAGGVLKLNFDAATIGARAMARAGNISARFWSIGRVTPLVEGEPLIARAFDLPGAEEEADWVALAARLAGTRLLREAIDVTEAMPRAGGKDQQAAAQEAAVARAMLASYGAAIGTAGAAATGRIVARGVGALRDREARATWRGHLGIAALVGLAGALICIASLSGRYGVEDDAGARFPYLILATLIAGLAWGIAGHVRVRRRLKALARELDLETPLSPPGHGWTRSGWLLAALITATTLTGGLYGAWRLRVPPSFRLAVDARLDLAGGAYGTIYAPAALPLHPWPDAASPVVATIKAGADVRVHDDEDGDGWVMVSADGLHGYVELGAFAPSASPSKR